MLLISRSTIKMFNKKAAIGGLEWDALLFATLVIIVASIYFVYSVDLPKVGEISLEMIKTLEKNSRIPIIIEGFMKWINEKTIPILNGNKIFILKSYCENEDYKQRIAVSHQVLNGGFGAIEGKNANCHINEDDLMEYFEIVFEAEYNDFRLKDLGDINLDLSKTTYTSFVDKKNNDYFNIVSTSNGVEIPLKIKKDWKEKQIGRFTMKPAFKLPIDYDFKDLAKEVCILSTDCGATCEDVIKKYPGKNYKIKEYPCNEYFFCNAAEDSIDDFGKTYPCNGYLCEDSCPDCYCTNWVSQGCSGSNRVYTRECRHKTCGLPEVQYVYDDCCADPICCGNYPRACECGRNPCCTKDSSLCEPEEVV